MIHFTAGKVREDDSFVIVHPRRPNAHVWKSIWMNDNN